MMEQIAEIPAQGIEEAVDVARKWSNDKTFQIGVHTMRGNLTPVEAGKALSNVAEASIAAVLSAVEEDYVGRRGEGGVAAVVRGDLASGEVASGAELDVAFVYVGGPPKFYGSLCRSFFERLRELSRENLLFTPVSRDRQLRAVRSLTEFTEHHRTVGKARELFPLTRARCVFASGDADIATRFDRARQEILIHGAARNRLVDRLRKPIGDAPAPGLSSIRDMRGGLLDVERAARLLYMTHAEDTSAISAPSAVAILEAAGAHGLIPTSAAGRLAAAATMWRNLRGVLRLVAEDGLAIETAGPGVRAVVARACGMDDFAALAASVPETASRAAADIDALAA